VTDVAWVNNVKCVKDAAVTDNSASAIYTVSTDGYMLVSNYG
jgi:hypothetical protein